MDTHYEMKNVGQGIATDIIDNTEAIEVTNENGEVMQKSTSSSNDRDTFVLARLGKKQVLKRNFGFLSMVAFSCTVLVTWEGVYTSVPDYINGGSAGLVYGYLAVWAGTLSTFVSIAELASIAPTSGGQYHWVAMLAPAKSRKFMSYITGWMTVVAWQAAIASGAFLAGTIIQGLIILNYADYVPMAWHGTLLIWACLLVAVFVNTVVSGLLPLVESVLLIVHILGFITVFIILCYMAPHGTASDVFTVFYNGGGWPTQGLSVMVGLIGLVFAFVGADAAVHMSEEIRNANVNVPRSIVTSVFLNGVLGFAILLATLFGIGDINAALTTPTGYPFIEIFTQATNSNGGGIGMSAIIIIMVFAATIGFTATSSRMIWAFARDKGLPFSPFLGKVHHRTSIPLNSVFITTLVATLLGLINLGSAVVLNNIFSLSIAGFYSTYFACIALLLWRRLRGDIREPHEVPDNASVVTDVNSGRLTWGPWRVKGWFGTAINAFACIYLVIILFFSCWPPIYQVTPATMNYSVVVVGAVLIFSVFYYFVFGKGNYRGPVIEIVL